jgi:hypothetical protein
VNDYAVLVAFLAAALVVDVILAEAAMRRALKAFAASFSMYQPRDPKVRVYGGVHDWEREGEL